MAKFTKKTIIISSALGLAGILSAGLAVAGIKHHKYHHHNGDHAYDRHGGHMMKLHKLDSDENEMISLSEFQAPAMKTFEALDSNQDGIISSDEYLAKTADRFAKLDRDESGMIETGEMPRRHRFKKGDS